MPYIQGENREQMTLAPMCLDDYIAQDSICRVIAAYVGSLDMVKLGFQYAETKDTGARRMIRQVCLCYICTAI